MNRYKKCIANFSAAALLITAATFAHAAQTFNVTSDGDGGFTADYGNSFGKTATNQVFDNKYYFTSTSWFTASGDLTSSYLGTKFDLDIYTFQLVSYNANNNTVIHTYVGSNDTVSGSQKDEWSFADVAHYQPGTYYFEVTGKVTGTSGGSYGGTVNVTAVPEPETYGMLLAGLGLMGFVVRRRNPRT